MAFYLIPPSGNVGIDLLRKWTVARAKFLRDVYDCQDDKHALKQLVLNGIASTNYQYLIEGTSVDSVTHFMLRLACAGDFAAEHTFMTAEISLFCYRLQSLGKARLKHFIRQFHRLRKYFLNSTEISNPCVELKDVRELLSALDDCSIDWNSVTAGYISLAMGRHVNSQLIADNFHIAVPFRFMLWLVAKRKVLLSKGMALLTASQLPQVFVAVFRQWLKYGVLLAKMRQPNVTTGDDRFKLLFAECRILLRGGSAHGQPWRSLAAFNGIRCNDIDTLVAQFPPCMRHLHNCLRRKHRLRHMSRMMYTLFLKDIGMSVHEALQFWSAEYSKPAAAAAAAAVAGHSGNGSHGCAHSWHQSAGRYTYSVHHLYGLVGRRANYSSYSCHTIQSQLWAVGEEASCPFKHHTRASLRQMLQPSSESVLYKMCSLLDAGDYCAACRLHLLDRCLTIESCSDILNTAGKSTVCETVSAAEHMDDDKQVAETLYSGHDSAQSMQENCTTNCVSMNHDSVLTDADNRLANKSTDRENPPMSAGVPCADEQCSSVPLKLDVNHCISNVDKQHSNGSESDTVAKKLHSPVDFYTSFNCLVAGLQSHAVS